VTTADEALTKGHVRYLEARLIEMTKSAGRVALENTQVPDADRRRLPEADRANMEAFLANLKVVLPVIGLDLLKPRPLAIAKNIAAVPGAPVERAGFEPRFEVRHKSGVKAFAIEEDGEFVVLKGSEALKDTDYAHNSYARLKDELINDGTLQWTAILRPQSRDSREPTANASAVAFSACRQAVTLRGGGLARRRDRSGRSSVTVKKKRSADTEPLMVGGCTPLSAW
jgi:hypothetical protein